MIIRSVVVRTRLSEKEYEKLKKMAKRYEHFKINSLGKEKPTTTLFQQVP